MSGTDWRALCEELASWIERSTRHYIQDPEVLIRAREALAQPEPEVVGPTYDDLSELCAEHGLDADSWPIEKFDALWEVARSVLTRWSRPAPVPAEGEVGELVRWLRMQAQKPGPNSLLSVRTKDERHAAGMKLTRAAYLLERQAAPVPVAVSERLPEPSVKVLAHYFNVLGKGRTICAIWVPAKTLSDSYGDDDFTEYDEESDTFYWPEGWYEVIENWDDFGYVKVYEGEVMYWQPLPKWPAHALPQSSGEVKHG